MDGLSVVTLVSCDVVGASWLGAPLRPGISPLCGVVHDRAAGASKVLVQSNQALAAAVSLKMRRSRA
jgi:hypothetical protein